MDSSSARPTPESPKKTYRIMALMAIVAMGLIGIMIYSFSQMNNAPHSATTLPIPTITPTLRQKLPQFEYSDQGKVLNAQSLSGHWTLLTFWAYWCGPCLEEMPALDQLNQQWQGAEFEVLSVNTDKQKSDDLEAAKKFLSDEGIALPTLFDKDGLLQTAFGVKELPQHFLINPQNEIVWTEKGAFRWNEAKTRDQLMKIMEDSSAPDPESEPETAE